MQKTYLLGSADLMPRNLDHRIEVVVPVEDPHVRNEIERSSRRSSPTTPRPGSCGRRRRGTASAAQKNERRRPAQHVHAPPRAGPPACPARLTGRRHVGSARWRRARRGRRCRFEHRPPARGRGRRRAPVRCASELRLGESVERHGAIPESKLAVLAVSWDVRRRGARRAARELSRCSDEPGPQAPTATSSAGSAPPRGRRRDPDRATRRVGWRSSARSPQRLAGRRALPSSTSAGVRPRSSPVRARDGPRLVASIDLGSQRLTSRLLAGDPPGAAAVAAARAEVARHFDAVRASGRRLGVRGGGSARALRRLYGSRLGGGELDRGGRAPDVHHGLGAVGAVRRQPGARRDARSRRRDPRGAAGPARSAAEGLAHGTAPRCAARARRAPARGCLSPALSPESRRGHRGEEHRVGEHVGERHAYATQRPRRRECRRSQPRTSTP